MRIIKPTIKSLGSYYLGSAPTMQALGKSIIRSRRSTGTVVEAALGHKSASEVYEARRAERTARRADPKVRATAKLPKGVGTPEGIEGNGPAGPRYSKRSYTTGEAPSPGELIVDDPRLKVYKRGGGWARVVYTDPNASTGTIEFSIRMNKIKDALAKTESAWYTRAEGVYAKWIQSTAKGAMYTDRRQVEGMLKVAIRKGDTALADELRALLAKDDRTVSEWRQKWLSEHTDVEIRDFYDYDVEPGMLTEALIDPDWL